MTPPSSPQTTPPKNSPDYFGAGTPQSQTGVQQGSYQDQINDLTDLVMQLVASHLHNGSWGTRINLETDIAGFFQVVSTVPAATPQSLYDQVKIYTNGTTYRLYWYDTTAHTWHYATGT